MYIFVDFHQSVHKRFQIFYPEHIFYLKFKKKKRLTELSKLMTETQTDSVYRLGNCGIIGAIWFLEILLPTPLLFQCHAMKIFFLERDY